MDAQAARTAVGESADQRAHSGVGLPRTMESCQPRECENAEASADAHSAAWPRWTPPDLLHRPRPPIRLPTAAELAVIEDEARQAGFAAGFQEGRDAGFDSAARETRARAERLLRADRQRLAGLAEAWRDQWPDTVAALEPTLIDLVERVARKVIITELQFKPERIKQWIKAALEQVPDDERHVTITLHPEDALLLLGRTVKTGTVVKWTTRVSVQASDDLRRGDLELDGPAIHIDYKIEKRIDAALDALRAGLTDRSKHETGASLELNDESKVNPSTQSSVPGPSSDPELASNRTVEAP